jgi:hypothetical protein
MTVTVTDINPDDATVAGQIVTRPCGVCVSEWLTFWTAAATLLDTIDDLAWLQARVDQLEEDLLDMGLERDAALAALAAAKSGPDRESPTN